jgi:cytochrome c oxidase subunit 4
MSHHEHGHDCNHDSHGDHVGHIVPGHVYRNILIALMVLTVITVGVAQIEFGGVWNIIVAMIVASIKATLVALFFMHLKYEDKFTWIYAVIPLFLLFLLIGGVFIDNPFRIAP